MDRLSALDAEFLHLEDGVTHMHIAGISVFEGPPPSIGELRAAFASRLHLIPRYRQRVRSVPLELGRPIWVDDPHFLLDYHVRHTALPKPGDDAALRALMGRLMSQPLDRDRPLWEAWLVEGMEGDRWALISKIHHCMVDGVSGVDLLAILLDLDREVELPEPRPWEPAPEPANLARVVDAWAGAGADLLAKARSVPGMVTDALGSVRALGDTLRGIGGYGRLLDATPPLAIEGPIGPHRRWAHSSVSIADIRTIRAALGGTLNDVVLAATTGGYRTLLQSLGDDPDTAVVRSLVPVSVRGEDERGIPDNRVSALLLELPVGIDDPVGRLTAVRAAMAELKGSHMAEAGKTVTDLAALAPPMVLGTVSRLATRALHQFTQRSLTTVTTNVPGPQFPLYCLGREMVAHLPFVPLGMGIRVGTAILSYNGRIAFGVTSDLDSVPDPAVLADAIPVELGRLLAVAQTAGAGPARELESTR
jgi:WS/DGAT/MGAT family acyltransferase